MKYTLLVVILFIFVSVPVCAGQSHRQSPGVVKSKPSEMTVPACRILKTLRSTVEGVFDSAARDGSIPPEILADQEDATWDKLTDCADGSKNESERAEALRLAAIWEHARADAFRGTYKRALPLKISACDDLDKLGSIVTASERDHDWPGESNIPIRQRLLNCITNAHRENDGIRPESQESYALRLLSGWTDMNVQYLANKYNELSSEHEKFIAEANVLVSQHNTLARDYEKLLAASLQYSKASEAYTHSLEQAVLFPTTQRRPLVCAGTSRNYGTWGTFNVDCR